MIATGLSASTQSGVGIAAATVSLMISYEISQKFKELAKDNPDGKLTEKQQAAHVLAHAVLGAAVAAAGGNDALAGGASAGGAEYLAPKVNAFLYGTADPEKLTAEQKDTVANIMSLAGAGVGSAVGNTSTNAVSGSLNAESAVENNYVTTIATKGRKVVQIAKQGKLPTGKDILPIAEAGLLVATACAITRECDGKEVLSDVWSGKFEDEFSLSSENINSSGNQKQSNNQLTNTSQTATGSPQIEPPDEEQSKNKDKNDKVDNILNNSVQRTNRNSLSQYDRNITNQNSWQQANKDFDSLNLQNVRTFQTKYGEGRIGTLPDGRIVNVRPGSSNGQITLEIKSKSSNKVIKIRY